MPFLLDIYSGSEVEPVLMCWYNPDPINVVGHHILRVHPVKTMQKDLNLDEGETEHNWQGPPLSNIQKMGKEMGNMQPHIVQVNPVQEEHLKIEDIDAELCTHIIYNSVYIKENESLVIKSGDLYEKKQQMKGR